jgi:hypothetical protein
MSIKIPVTPAGTEAATFGFVPPPTAPRRAPNIYIYIYSIYIYIYIYMCVCVCLFVCRGFNFD